MTRKQLKKYLIYSEKIIFTLEDWVNSRQYGKYPLFNVYFLNKGEFIKYIPTFFAWEDKEKIGYPAYWNEKKLSFAPSGFGSDRVFEVLHGLVYYAGFKDKALNKAYNKTVLL
ncbi:MAG: hypothetical protein ABIL76_08510 [candidate division WOR-3 bacterium]